MQQPEMGSWTRPGTELPPPPTGPSTRRKGRFLAAVAAALLVIVAGAAAAAFILMRGSSEEILQLVPASSEVVVTAYLDPSAGQKVNLMSLAHRFPALKDRERLSQAVDDALDQALRDAGLTHQDVLPWLGSQVAVVVDLGSNDSVPTTSVLIATTDDGAAESALERGLDGSLGSNGVHEYRGVAMHDFGTGDSMTTYAIVDHVVVISNHAIGLTRVIDVSKGSTPAIADDQRFQDTVSALPRGKLALVYVNPSEIVNQAFSGGLGLVAGGVPGIETLEALQGVGVSVSAQPDGLSFDVTASLDPTKLDPATRAQLDQPVHENAMLRFVPKDAFAVALQQGVDVSLKRLVDQGLFTAGGESIRRQLGLDDTLAALTGDLALEVSPGSGPVPVAGAILIGIHDGPAAQRTLDGLAQVVLAAQRKGSSHGPGARWRTTKYHATTIRFLDVPSLSSSGVLPAYAVADGAAIIASSPAEVRRVLDTKDGRDPDISTSSGYRSALAQVPKGGSTFYLDAAALVSRFTPLLPSDVAANLRPFRTVVEGSTNSSSRITERVFIEIR
jgi:Protein of unknown function (DUF3352)